MQVVELAATQIKSQTTVNLLLKVQLGRQGKAYLHKQERVIDIHHKCRRTKRGFIILRIRKLSNADNSEGLSGICSLFVGCFFLLGFFFFCKISLLLCGDW